ncbi:hypothetical protein TU74_11540 [Pseudomonas lundensis]|nr:hypothetical protein TU74_11540 [Pseudomonas lundensis]
MMQVLILFWYLPIKLQEICLPLNGVRPVAVWRTILKHRAMLIDSQSQLKLELIVIRGLIV